MHALAFAVALASAPAMAADIPVALAVAGRFRALIKAAKAAGGTLSVLTYILTLSCLVFTPGFAPPEAGGSPALSAKIGQFLPKDFVLLAASMFILGDALTAMQQRS